MAKSEIHMIHVWWTIENWVFHHTDGRENDFAISIAFGEVESARTSTRPIEKLPVSNGAGFITLSGPEKRYKTSKPPRFTKYDQEPEFTENIAGVPLILSKDVLELWLLGEWHEV